jgi:hypothetical protein
MTGMLVAGIERGMRAEKFKKQDSGILWPTS